MVIATPIMLLPDGDISDVPAVSFTDTAAHVSVEREGSN